MTGHAVVIAGGGPTGLVLAGELALAGIDVAIVERRTSPVVAGSRAGGLHARTIEVLDQRGIADRFVSEGTIAQVASFAGTPLDISDFPTRHPYGLGLWQRHIERLLAEWIGELDVRFHRGLDVTGFVQDTAGVDVELSDGRSLRAEYLVGCDGGRSGVRKAAGIEFPGWEPTTSFLIAEVELAEEPPWGMRKGRHRHPWLQPAGLRAGAGHGDRAAPRTRQRGHPGRTQRRPPRGVGGPTTGCTARGRSRGSPTWPAGRGLPRPAGPAGRRRGPRAQPGGRPGPQRRRAGCRQPGLEARPGGPAGRRRTASWTPTTPSATRSPPASCATRSRRSRCSGSTSGVQTLGRHLRRAPRDGRAAAPVRREDVRPGRPLRPRRGASAARASHAPSRPGRRRRRAAGLHPAARCPAGAARPRRTRRTRHRAVVGPRTTGRGRARGCVGAPGARRRPRPPPC